MRPFISYATAVLTSTTTSQTITTPTGTNSVVVYNGGSYPVFLRYGSSVAVPGSSFAPGVSCVQPGTTQTFADAPEANTLAYIAQTSGGLLVISVGEGV